MKRENKLEKRLKEWVSEYGGGKHVKFAPGTSWLWSMIRWGGRAPSGLGQPEGTRTAADEVQEAVESLQRQAGGWIPACVLRAEYFSTANRYVKLQRLARIGMRMDESRYSRNLRIAKVHIAAWLKIPFDDDRANNVEEEIAMLELLVELDSEAEA